ncbi:MAG: PFL_4669 family integrating conjugative element protein [Vicinamibacterales bacterium]
MEDSNDRESLPGHEHAGRHASPQAATYSHRLDSPAPDASAPTGGAGDAMLLHTREAYRMFTGRRARSDSSEPAVVGGQRFATLTKVLWNLSAQDNPYADWMLIRLEAAMQGVRNDIHAETVRAEAIVAELQRKGLTITILGARSPTSVPLAFRSPYGYAMAELITEFDYYVRVVKTLVYRDQWSDTEGRSAIRGVGRPMRAVFVMPTPWVRALLDGELLALSRRDFAFEASPDATARVDLAHRRLGQLPDDVLTGAQRPRHTRRPATASTPHSAPDTAVARRDANSGLL